MSASDPHDKLQHPCFPQPKDVSVSVWRYFDLPKFIWLLTNRKLFLPRLDLLQDRFEGSTPRPVVKARDEQMLALTKNGRAGAHIAASNERSRKTMYVSCWHLGNDESEAMWRLYCPSDLGVALQTTYERLTASLVDDPFFYIGLIRYIDYETEWFPAGNTFYAPMHKRKSFSHENEVRLLKSPPEYWTAGSGPSQLEFPWDAEEVVRSIYVSPYAPAYFHDVVKAVVSRFAPKLEHEVRWSQMYAGPVF